MSDDTSSHVWVSHLYDELLYSSSNAVKSPSTYPECFRSCCYYLLQLPGPPVLALFSNRCTGSRYRKFGTYWIESYLHHIYASSSNLLHVRPTCAISSQSSLLNPLDHPHWSLQLSFDSSLMITNCRLLPVYATPSSYSSCSLSFRSFMINQLFSIVILWSWTAYVDLSCNVFHFRLNTIQYNTIQYNTFYFRQLGP